MHTSIIYVPGQATAQRATQIGLIGPIAQRAVGSR
jgi:hypothetical protein